MLRRFFPAAALALLSLASPGRAELQVGGVFNGGYIVLNSATQGQFYSWQFTVTGGVAPYSWSAISPLQSGFIGIPAGLSLDPTSGLLSGIPTVAISRTSYFTISVSDSSANPQVVQVNVGIKIFPASSLGLSPGALPDGVTGQNYSAAINATGGSPPYTFNISGLPSGLAASSSGGISGVVQRAGAYNLAVTVTDSANASATGTFTVLFAPPPSLTISPTNPVVAAVGIAYSQTLNATGGTSPYTWMLVSGSLPPGVTLHPMGFLDGTPTTPGQYAFTLKATDAAGSAQTASFSVQIVPAPPSPITTALPEGFVNLPYQQQILTLSGGTPPYTFALANGSSLPGGLSLSNSLISGTPSSAGTSRFTIVASDSSSPAVSVPITLALTITNATQPNLSLNTASLVFNARAGATGAPSPQNIVVQSTNASTLLQFAVSASPAVSWLQTLPTSASTPKSLPLSINPAGVPAPSATPYQTSVSITCESPSCIGSTQTVSVSLFVTSQPASLNIADSLLSFVATTPQKLAQTITVQNTGGGALGVSDIACDSPPWCSVGSFASTVPGGTSIPVTVTVDPSLLSPGLYRAGIDAQTSGGSGEVAVQLLYTANSAVSLIPAGEQIHMFAGGAPARPNRLFSVGSNGSAPVNFTASVLPGVPWLQLGTGAGIVTGTVASGQSAPVSYSIVPPSGPGALSTGPHYGTIRVTAPGIINSPFDFEVVLIVDPAGAAPQVEPQPAGVLFIAKPGSGAESQQLNVYSDSVAAVSWSASATAQTLPNWLSVSPATGMTSATAPGYSTVTVSATGLPPGIYSGGITYSITGGGARTANITLVVQPASQPATGSGRSRATKAEATSSCAPAVLAPTQTGLVNNFSAPAAWPTALTILLADNCGNTVSNGQVVTTFSNGDPPLALPLVDAAQGLYSATWTPRTAAAQVTVLARATATGFPAATTQITGAVAPNAVPLLIPNGAVHPYNPQTGGPLAPGTIISIYGTNLASGTGQPSGIPLPTFLNNTSVLIAGVAAPLFYVSPRQINAQIPYELADGNQYQVIVTTNGAISSPESIELATATPGIAALPDGTVIAQHPDGSLVSAQSPAKPGEYLVIYLLGLGDTDNAVATGDASPSSPLARPDTSSVLLVGGASTPYLFAGLTPGLVGLYQMNFQVPADLAAGIYPIVVTQGTQSSNKVTFPVQP